MKATATEFRARLYGYLDEVIRSGEALEIVRKGVRLKVIRDDSSSKLSRLKRRRTIRGDPEDIVSIDWSNEWKAEP